MIYPLFLTVNGYMFWPFEFINLFEFFVLFPVLFKLGYSWLLSPFILFIKILLLSSFSKRITEIELFLPCFKTVKSFLIGIFIFLLLKLLMILL